MEAAVPPLPPDTWEALPPDAQAIILALQAQAVALQTENAALQAQCRELQARLGAEHMHFGPLDLEACGENNFTIKSLGVLASRFDLRRRFVEFLCPDSKPLGEDTDITMLFFTRLGEGFFREAIERAGRGPDLEKLEARLNPALGLPDKFRWARTKEGRLIQPAKWQQRHIQAMLKDNGESANPERHAHLGYIQDVANTEPDIVLQWDNHLTIVEIKVLSGEGVNELKRQRDLANLLAVLLGWETHFFYIGPEYGPRPILKDYNFHSWAKVASLFGDTPEIADYINSFAFFYRGVWQSMIARPTKQPDPTAYDRLMERVPQDIRPSICPPDDDTWHFRHIQRAYFEGLCCACQQAGAWPVEYVWLGNRGRPFSEQPGKARPNAMIECNDGSKWKWLYRGRRLTKGEFNRHHMRRWEYKDIAAFFALGPECNCLA